MRVNSKGQELVKGFFVLVTLSCCYLNCRLEEVEKPIVAHRSAIFGCHQSQRLKRSPSKQLWGSPRALYPVAIGTFSTGTLPSSFCSLESDRFLPSSNSCVDSSRRTGRLVELAEFLSLLSGAIAAHCTETINNTVCKGVQYRRERSDLICKTSPFPLEHSCTSRLKTKSAVVLNPELDRTTNPY